MTPCCLRRPWPAALTCLRLLLSLPLLLPLMLPLRATAADATVRADPLDARAAVPAMTYPSPFSRYHRAAETRPLPWREANELVGRIGGWRAYAREAHAEPNNRPPQVPLQLPRRPAAAPSTTPQGHDGPRAHP